MGAYVAMLRGVNVGGHNRIKMPVLEALCVDLGHTDVVTFIQSGNVVFKSPSRSSAALARGIHERMARDLGLDVAVILRTKAELAKIVDANPFLRAKVDPAKLHVTFLAEPPAADLVRAVLDFDGGVDEIHVSGRDVYLHCPGGYGATKLSGAFVEKRLRAVATTRNWNTVTKLAELAAT